MSRMPYKTNEQPTNKRNEQVRRLRTWSERAAVGQYSAGHCAGRWTRPRVDEERTWAEHLARSSRRMDVEEDEEGMERRRRMKFESRTVGMCHGCSRCRAKVAIQTGSPLRSCSEPRFRPAASCHFTGESFSGRALKFHVVSQQPSAALPILFVVSSLITGIRVLNSETARARDHDLSITGDHLRSLVR